MVAALNIDPEPNLAAAIFSLIGIVGSIVVIGQQVWLLNKLARMAYDAHDSSRKRIAYLEESDDEEAKKFEVHTSTITNMAGVFDEGSTYLAIFSLLAFLSTIYLLIQT